MKTLQRFKNMFLIALPMYFFGLLILVIATLINPLWINLIFLLVGSIAHLSLTEFKTPSQEKLEWMTENMNQAFLANELDPIKQSMHLSIAAMKNANICAMLSDRDTENHHHWRNMYAYSNDLRMIHRESLAELVNDKNKP
jgi:hypothetical protein